MALLFVDGFDAGDTSLKWSFTWSGSRSADTRFGQGSSWNISPIGAYLYKNFSPVTQVYVGFAAKFISTTGQISFCRLLGDGGTITHLMLRYSSAGVLQLVRGDNTVLASTAAAPFAYNTWAYYFEMSATIADAGGTCEVRVNGQTVINFTGDTKTAGTNNSVDRLQFNPGDGSGLPNVMIDDLYVCDNTGSAPHNTFLGDIRIHTLTPNGAGSLTQMTPSAGANYTTVDELPYSATDYVTGSVGQTDLYTASDLPANQGTIYGVQANVVAKKTDAGTISARNVIKSGATTSNGATNALSSTDATYSDIYMQNPDTATAWTESDVNNLEIGLGGL